MASTLLIDAVHANRALDAFNATHDAGLLALDLAESSGLTPALPTDIHLLLSTYLRGCTRCGTDVALSTLTIGVHADDVGAGVDHSAECHSNSDDSGDELWRLPPDEDDHRPPWLRAKHLQEAKEAKLAAKGKKRSGRREPPKGSDGSPLLPRRLSHVQLEGWCATCHATAGSADTESLLDACDEPLATEAQLNDALLQCTHISITGMRITSLGEVIGAALRLRLDAFAAADAPTTGSTVPPLLGFTCAGLGMTVERRGMTGSVTRGAPLTSDVASLLTLAAGHARAVAIIDSDLEVSLIKAIAANHNEKLRTLTLSGTLWSAQSAASRSLKGVPKADFNYLRDVAKRFPKMHTFHLASTPAEPLPGRAVTGTGLWWEGEGLSAFRVPVPNVPDPSYLGETNEQCERRAMLVAPDGLGLASLRVDLSHFSFDTVQRISRAAWTLTTLHLCAKPRSNGAGDSIVPLLAELPKLTDLTLTNFPEVLGDGFAAFVNANAPLQRLSLHNDVLPPPPPPYEAGLPVPVRMNAGPEDATLDHIVALPHLTALSLRNAAWLTDKGLALLAGSKTLTSVTLIGVGRFNGTGFAAFAAQSPSEQPTQRLRHVTIEGSLVKSYWPSKKKRQFGHAAVVSDSEEEPTDDPDDTRDEVTKAADRPRRRELRLQRMPPKLFNDEGLCALALVPSLQSVTLRHVDTITDCGLEALGAGDETLAHVDATTGLSASTSNIEELCVYACQRVTIAPLLRGVEEGAPLFPRLRVVRLQGHRIVGVIAVTSRLEADAPERMDEIVDGNGKVRQMRREIRASFAHLRPKLQVQILD